MSHDTLAFEVLSTQQPVAPRERVVPIPELHPRLCEQLAQARLAGGTLCYLAEVLGSIFLILGHGAGLYIAAVATVVLFGFLISGAWLLIVGIYESQADG